MFTTVLWSKTMDCESTEWCAIGSMESPTDHSTIRTASDCSFCGQFLAGTQGSVNSTQHSFRWPRLSKYKRAPILQCPLLWDPDFLGCPKVFPMKGCTTLCCKGSSLHGSALVVAPPCNPNFATSFYFRLPRLNVDPLTTLFSQNTVYLTENSSWNIYLLSIGPSQSDWTLRSNHYAFRPECLVERIFYLLTIALFQNSV